jgi:hypothetical protein
MKRHAKRPSFDVMGLLTKHNTRWTVSKYKKDQIVYAQGDPADSVFYIHRGKVKVAIVPKLGKEAIVAIRGPDEFLRRGSADWGAAAFGYNHHNIDMQDHKVDMRDHKVRACNPGPAASR